MCKSVTTSIDFLLKKHKSLACTALTVLCVLLVRFVAVWFDAVPAGVARVSPPLAESRTHLLRSHQPGEWGGYSQLLRSSEFCCISHYDKIIQLIKLVDVILQSRLKHAISHQPRLLMRGCKLGKLTTLLFQTCDSACREWWLVYWHHHSH